MTSAWEVAAVAMTARYIKTFLWCGLLLCSTPVWAQSEATPQDRMWFASTDPKHKNDDYLMLKPGETRRIPLAAGALLRLWSTALEPEKITLQLNNGTQTINLLRDGKPRYGQYYEKAFSLYPTRTLLYRNQSIPETVRSLNPGAALVVKNRASIENKLFYQATVERKGDVKSIHSALIAYVKNSIKGDYVSGKIGPGEELDLKVSKYSPGAVTGLSIDVKPVTLEAFQSLRLRGTWDEGAPQAVDVPLSALAGQFFGLQVGSSAEWSFDGKRLSLRYLMPFRKNAKLTLYNSGRQTLDVTAVPQVQLMDSWPVDRDYRFCAAYGSARTQKGKPLEMLNVQGKGAFIGLNLAIAPVPETRRFSFAYLEGNEIITADGKKFEGTGTEDFFDSAWYFPEKPYSHPSAGMTYKSKEPPKVSMYRLMLPDAVPFQKSLKFEMGHGSSNNTNDLEYHWVAFWYQQPPLKFRINDELKGQWGASSEGHSTPGAATGPSMPLFGRIVFFSFGGVFAILVIWTLKRVLRRPS